MATEPFPRLTPDFHVMLKPAGARCNLACRYCFYLEKAALYPGGTFRMSDAVLERFTRQYIAAQPGPEIVFAWQGGEPALMGLDFFRRAVALQGQYCCNGECPKNRLLTTPDGEPGLNYLCEGYKLFFTHIAGPMARMAQLLRAGRPAAEVMG